MSRIRSTHGILALALTAGGSLWACGEPADTPPGDDTPKGSFIRVHYRVQGSGDPTAWGLHFWGAGTTTPAWGKPQRLDKKDAFGAYTDIEVKDTADGPDAWLGLIPVLCAQGNCRKDVETSARFADLTRSKETPNIAECWITQGQAIQIQPPAATGSAYRIQKPRDFIDLGDGSVRMMFRVAPGSTGTVDYGTSAAALDKRASWSATDDVNKSGVLLRGLSTGSKVFYKISTQLGGQTDATQVLELTPIAFSPVTQAADYAGWGQKGVMYQLIVRTFADGGTPKAAGNPASDSGIDPAQRDGIGDLVGLRSKLPYLKDLGVDAIWMTPVFKAKSYHGYDTTDFYDIDPQVGTLRDFSDLTAAAHAQGIKIILDLVQNHVADVNPWFLAASDPKSPDHAKYRDWFVWSDEFSNMYTDKHPWDDSAVVWACKNYACYHQIFSASMPELNFHNPEVRAEMKRIAEYWIKLGADGYRLDASKHIDQFDDNNRIALPIHGTHVWWKEFNSYVKKGIARPMGAATVLLTGENRWDDPADTGNMIPYGSDMDTQFDFPFRSVLSSFLGGKTGDDADFVRYVKNLAIAARVTANGGNENHFFQRFLSNHDLERPATQLGASPQAAALLKQAATVVLTLPGMPVIYYGEEFGKRGKRDKYLGTEPYDHDELIREPMSWFRKLRFAGDKQRAWDIDVTQTDADNAALMLGAGICKAPNPDYPFIKYMSEDEPASWAAQKDDPASLLSHYKKLLSIRRSVALLTDADTQLDVVRSTAAVYEYALSKGAARVSVVLSRQAGAQAVTRTGMAKDLLTDTTAGSFSLPGYGVLVLQE